MPLQHPSLELRRIVWILVAVALVASGQSLFADPLCADLPQCKVPNKIPLKASAFDLRDVRLLDGPFKHAQDLDKQFIVSFDVGSLLHVFRLNAGLPSSAKPLGGWETPESGLRGEFTGHYMTACALMYAATGDPQLKDRSNALVAGLAECQAKIGTGYLSGFPEQYVDTVEAGKPACVAYYCLHKIYAGLLDVYVYCDNPQALDVCKKAADWLIARNARLSDAELQKVLGTEHGGMNEVLADLYSLTGEEKYLKIAQRFNHIAVIGPASKRVDALEGLHANTQIPKFIGVARQFELTGDDSQNTAATFFWDTVVHERSYVIGGNSDSEAFSPKAKLSEALGRNTTETCNTYNMLKLTRHLFCLDPKTKYADYYERALYNHILASQNPNDGMTCYYVPLRAGMTRGGGSAGYCTLHDSCWCCTGTGIENHAKYGDSIYFHGSDNKSLYWNLFIASELNWKVLGVNVRQETSYPDDSHARLKLTCDKPTEFSLHIRRPWWATAGFEIRINGAATSVESKAGEYAVISRRWDSGDTVEVSMPFTLRTEGFRDNPKRLAIMHGPLVLCAEIDAKLCGDADLKTPFPGIVLEDGRRLDGLKPVAGQPSTFTGSADQFHISAAATSGKDVTFEPFHKMHGDRHYVVYWNSYAPAEWTTVEAKRRADREAEEARRRELAARTVDVVDPADEKGERDHHLQGERTAAGEFSGRKWRHATDGGWFSWDMKSLPAQALALQVTYWGSDVGREFDILVDGVRVAGQKLDNNRPGQLYEETYPLPKELTAGKDKLMVRFQGRPGGFAGGVFECRMLKKD